MANVSFYLIAILALHVKCHSLQERSVPGNVLIEDHHIKNNFMHIYSLGQLICFVSFKNQNWEMYCLLTAFYDPQNDYNFWNFWLGQIGHVILSHFIFRGRGIGGGVRENNAYRFLLRMANLLTLLHNGGIWKITAPI